MRAEPCDSCLYRLPYMKATRDRILAEVKRLDSYVECHSHDPDAAICCRGYWDAVGQDGGTPVQLAWRFEAMGWHVVEWVGPDDYPPPGDDDDDDWPDE